MRMGSWFHGDGDSGVSSPFGQTRNSNQSWSDVATVNNPVVVPSTGPPATLRK